MELEFDPCHDFDCLKYVKHVSKNKELCTVCMMPEKTRVPWDRYQLRCGHVAHTRCYRKWCTVKGKVACPCCGDVERTSTNGFCSCCNKFGHDVMTDGFVACN